MITAGVAFEPDVTAGNIPAGKGKVSGGSRETHNRPIYRYTSTRTWGPDPNHQQSLYLYVRGRHRHKVYRICIHTHMRFLKTATAWSSRGVHILHTHLCVLFCSLKKNHHHLTPLTQSFTLDLAFSNTKTVLSLHAIQKNYLYIYAKYHARVHVRVD